jgi:hypothetical protein
MLTSGVTAQKFEQHVHHIIQVRRSSLVHLLLSTQGSTLDVIQAFLRRNSMRGLLFALEPPRFNARAFQAARQTPVRMHGYLA